MRHPTDQPLPRYCDPWTFARDRRILSGIFTLADTQALKAWQGDNDEAKVYLEGYADVENRLHLKGQIKLSLTLECQRCLQAMPWHGHLSFDYILLRSEVQEEQMVDGSETLICAEDEMDLAWFFEEEVLLAMPMIAKHDVCESPMILSQSQRVVEEKENPFAQLKALINNKEQP